MKKLILLCLILTLLITTMTSCLINGTTEPVVITHNPKNLLYLEESDNTFDRREVYMSFTMPQDFVATSYTLQFSDSNSPYNFVT
ncbi:MAG: hypothetical protein EOM67_04080, partial [Spirochaetia bacterium]|nr:hypothetical protein [Spirochaetia bacterium]